jgi:hypothetical protein
VEIGDLIVPLFFNGRAMAAASLALMALFFARNNRMCIFIFMGIQLRWIWMIFLLGDPASLDLYNIFT